MKARFEEIIDGYAISLLSCAIVVWSSDYKDELQFYPVEEIVQDKDSSTLVVSCGIGRTYKLENGMYREKGSTVVRMIHIELDAEAEGVFLNPSDRSPTFISVSGQNVFRDIQLGIDIIPKKKLTDYPKILGRIFDPELALP